jgi:hypothetical protein
MMIEVHVHRTILTKLLVSASIGACCLLPQTAAAAGTQDQVVQIFTDTLKAAGAKGVEQDDITGDDSKFTLSGVKIDDGKADDNFTIEEITFIGAKPTADGGIAADEVDVNGLELTTPKGGSTAKTIKIMGYVSAAPAKIKVPGASHFDRFEATNLEGGDDANSVTVSYVLMTAADYANGLPHKGSIEIKGLVVPVKADDPQMAEVVALGYKELNIDATVSGSWDEKAGRAVLDGLTINAQNAGGIQLSVVLGGVTPDVAKQLAAAKGDANVTLGAMQGVLVESASLKIDNNSLFQRELTEQAKKQGTTSDQLLHQGTAMLPLLLTSIQNPAFEKKVADAVNAFVASPHSLTVKVTPAQPVPVAQIIGVASAAPQTLPDVLGVEVIANK